MTTSLPIASMMPPPPCTGIGAVLILGDDPDTICTVIAVVGLNVDRANGEEAVRTVVIDAREASETLRQFCFSAREDLSRSVSEGSV